MRDKFVQDIRDDVITISRRQFEHVISALDELYDELARVEMNVDAQLVNSIRKTLIRSDARRNTRPRAVHLKPTKRNDDDDV